jgi:hypothetical protein
VYVVWVRRWALDTPAEVDGAGMVDPRVTHYWDAGNVIGQPFLDRLGVDLGGLDYDFFLLFDRTATWGPDAPRPVDAGPADLPAELTITIDGAFWSPFGPTVHGGRLDTDLLITRTTMPLRVPAAALLRLVQARPPGADAQLNIQ